MRRASMVAGLLLLLGLGGCPTPPPGGTTPPAAVTCKDGVMAKGTCYSTLPEACSAINCPTDQCVTLESFPPQAGCQQQEAARCERTQTEAGGKCYNSPEEACATLSCPKEQCVVTRSAPGHAACSSTVPK